MRRRAAGEESLRFFTHEQVDQLLREGSKQGRRGSHAAIERILKHEPALERPELWKRIRQLKYLRRGNPARRSEWTPRDVEVLQSGYSSDGAKKREAISELLKRHPDWHPSVIWKRAARLGISQKKSSHKSTFPPRPWSDEEEERLLRLAGDHSLRAIARALRRSRNAVRSRLALLGKTTRVQPDAFTRRSLAADLHMGWGGIQRLIVDGLLEVRDPRITPKSIARVVKSEALTRLRTAGDSDGKGNHSGDRASIVAGLSRAKHLWSEIAGRLNVSRTAVEKLIAQGSLTLYDPRITEESLRRFCRNHGALVNYDLLDRETKEWLRTSMDLNRNADGDLAAKLAVRRQHARITRTCEKCGRTIRGNAFFRHTKDCDGDGRDERAPAAGVM